MKAKRLGTAAFAPTIVAGSDIQKREVQMSNAIQILEDLGRSPVERSATGYAATITSWGLSPSEHRAFLDRDPKAIRELLGARENALCMITTPEEPGQRSSFHS